MDTSTAVDISVGLSQEEARVTALALSSFIDGNRTLLQTDPPTAGVRVLVQQNIDTARVVLDALDSVGARRIAG